MGTEEIEYDVVPVLDRAFWGARSEGMTSRPHYRAEQALTTQTSRPRPNAVLAMYHDRPPVAQANMGLAMRSNITLALPIIRTSLTMAPRSLEPGRQRQRAGVTGSRWQVPLRWKPPSA